MKKHIGSTIALILGFLSFAGSVANPSNPSGLIGGPVIILGALAYRSAKKRKFGEVHDTSSRKRLEVLALIIVAAAILLQKDLRTLITTDPIPNLIIPLWVIIAYVVIAFKTRQAIGLPQASAFSLDQLGTMQGLVTDELERIEAERKQIIEEGACRGQTLSVDKVLTHVEELKASYAAAGHTEEARKLEQMIADFRGKYGSGIPVDVAYRLMKDLENRES